MRPGDANAVAHELWNAPTETMFAPAPLRVARHLPRQSRSAFRTRQVHGRSGCRRLVCQTSNGRALRKFPAGTRHDWFALAQSGTYSQRVVQYFATAIRQGTSLRPLSAWTRARQSNAARCISASNATRLARDVAKLNATGYAVEISTHLLSARCSHPERCVPCFLVPQVSNRLGRTCEPRRGHDATLALNYCMRHGMEGMTIINPFIDETHRNDPGNDPRCAM